MQIVLPFDSSQQVSSGLALLFVFVLSMSVGWWVVNMSENIIPSVANSSIVKLEKRGVPIPDVNGNN